MNWLLLFIPVTLGIEMLHAPAPWVFFSAALAIVPIAALIVRSTEQVATYTGPTIGGLLNASFGNAPELIVALVALRAGLLDMVRASLAGGILANLLLALGLSFLAGGLRHHTQTYNAAAARLYGSMMLIAAFSLMVPSAFSRFLAPEETVRSEALLNFGLAAVLLAAYALYLFFQLKTHPDEFLVEPGAVSDPEEGAHGPRWSLPRALASLLVAAVAAAWMSEVLVGAAQATGEALGMSDVFIGIVFLAIVGGAAGPPAAIVMAIRNKMDLSLGIALGAAIQIALFVAPVLVLASYFIAPQPLELSFTRAEVGALFMGALIGAVVAGDGRANWYKGVQLIAVYLIIALMFYFIPSTARADEKAAEGWKFTLTPYIWLPNVNGSLKYPPPPAVAGGPDVNTGPNNYLENLSLALMLSGEARNGKWSVISDLVYIDFDKEKSDLRSVNFGGSLVSTTGTSQTSSSLSGVEWTLAGGYTVVQTPRLTLDALGGFRYFGVKATSDWQLSATVTGPGGAQTFPASGSISRRTDIVDAIIGVRGRYRFVDTAWSIPYYLDLGTGSSRLTTQSLLGVAYTFKWGDLVFAYRRLSYDQDDDKLFHDFRFSGPTLGASFHF